MGNYITLTGKADRIDPVFRTLQVGDIVVPFEDLVAVSYTHLKLQAQHQQHQRGAGADLPLPQR